MGTPSPKSPVTTDSGRAIGTRLGSQRAPMSLGQQAQVAFKLAISLALYYPFAFWVGWDLPSYGATAIIVVSLDSTGATIQKGAARLVGTFIGLIISLVAVALFAQEPMQMLAFLCVALGVTVYGMQSARFDYAWYLAAFLPVLVWSKSYQNESYTFHYAVFRFLETAAGVTFYTLISAILWPRHAGDELKPQGSRVWKLVAAVFDDYRALLNTGKLPGTETGQHQKLSGALTQLSGTLDRAYKDTPPVIRGRPLWEDLRASTRALVDSMELWRESIGDVRAMQPDTLIPGLAQALDCLGRRITRIGAVWESSDASDDADLLRPLDLRLDETRAAQLSHFDRAAATGFLQQLQTVDRTSRQALATLRVLRDFDPISGYKSPKTLHAFYKPSRWRPELVPMALFVPICTILGFAVWYLFDPPGGAGGVFMAANMALVVTRTGGKPQVFMLVIVATIVLVVLPIYTLLLPGITKGLDLAVLLFVLTFVFVLLAKWVHLLQVLPMLLLVNLAGLSNHQSYSFPGLISGIIMIVVALMIVITVYMLMIPSRREQILVDGVRRFFRGCSIITSQWDSLGSRSRALRRRSFESMVIPAAKRLSGVGSRSIPGGDPAHVQRLIDAVSAISRRLESADLAHSRIAECPQSLADAMARVHHQMSEEFARWGQLDTRLDNSAMTDLAREIQRDIQQSLDGLEADDEDATEAIYASLGGMRGLVHAMRDAQSAIDELDWKLLTRVRFG